MCGGPLPPGARLYCGAVCYRKADYLRERATAEGAATHRLRFARWYARCASWQAWRTILRRTGAATPERLAALDTLRERGRVPAPQVRELLGLPPVERREPDPADPWAAPAPLVGPYLPGGYTSLRLDPVLPLDVQHLRHLHGALSRVVARPHTRLPAWAVIPPPDGSGLWRVWWRLDSDAETLQATEHRVRLALRDRALTLGVLRRVLAPRRPRPGRHVVRVESLTAVVQSRDGHRTAVTRPTEASLRRACETVAERLVLPLPPLALELVSVETEPARVHVGGHWQRGRDEDEPQGGVLRGWEGAVTARCNAPAAWLLQCAETLGLGGATSLGMGRVKVTEVSR